MSVKFLRPPPLPPAGDIIIKQERDVQAAPLPPHHVTQKPPAPIKPPPQIIRERPPAPPPTIPPEVHSIPGRVIPPPPRKLIIERLPQLPAPPADVIIERWLEYPERVRRVIYESAPPVAVAPAPRNLHIVWDQPQVSIKREFKNLGIVVANPAAYASQHGPSLLHSAQIPSVGNQVRPADGQPLACETSLKPPRLVGNLHALRLAQAARSNLPAYETPYTPFGSQYAVSAAAPPPPPPAVSSSLSALSSGAPHYVSSYLNHAVGSGFASYAAGSHALNARNSMLAPSFSAASVAYGSGSAYGSAGALLDKGQLNLSANLFHSSNLAAQAAASANF